MDGKSIVVISAILLCGCMKVESGQELKSPSDTFLIQEHMLEEEILKANNGDIRSIKRLIAHYEAASGYEDVAELWRHKARELGDPQELYYLAARNLTAAKRSSDNEEKARLLDQALDSAVRSYSRKKDPATLRLVEEIRSILSSLQST